MLLQARWFRCCVSAGLVAAGSFMSRAADKPLEEELPRIPHVELQDALKTFSLPQGYQLELVAGEPNVSDPVDACFDDRGRMYVVEMHDYPYSHEPTKLNPNGGGKVGAGVVRLLEDSNGDGRMDRSWQFATGISWPLSVTPYDGGVFVLAPPNLWYFKDTNGDHIADVRKVVFEGFARDNVQALANNLKWGSDHRIYAAGATNPSVLLKNGQELLKLGRSDFSFDPRTEVPQLETGGVQFGHSFDDWGNRYVCSNSNHIQQVLFPAKYVSRNPFYTPSGTIRSIAKEGAAAVVFRKSPAEPWRIVRTRRRAADPKFAHLPETERVPIGFFTSATGVTIYRGSANPELRGQAFIGDVGGNLIHRKTMTPNGAAMLATRADEGVEFVASTDNWFRPTNFVNAPDGSLYILDMYRETIEHPASIPEDIKSLLDLYSGDNRGRVYRVVGPQTKLQKVERLGDLPTAELVARLESLNAWTRETAHRLLWERRDMAAVEPLRQLAKSSSEPLARMHALRSLAGLKALTVDDVLPALKDAYPRVREHAIQLAEPFADSPGVLDAFAALASDSDQRLLFQLALSLGESKQARGSEILGALLRRADLVADVRAAALTSVGTNMDSVLLSLAAGAESPDLLSDLAQMTGAQPDVAKVNRVLKEVCASKLNFNIQRAVVRGIGDGLQRRGSSLRKWLSDRMTDSEARSVTAAFFATQSLLASEAKASPNERAAAALLIASADDAATEELLAKLLSPTESQAVQVAAVRGLGRMTSANIPKTLLGAWKGYSPQVRADVVEALLLTIPRAEALLAAVEAGDVRPAEISPDRKQVLLNHSNAGIKDRAKKVLGADINSDRAAVVKTYSAALELMPSLERGQMTFTKKCSQCHKLGQQGFAVGPDIVSVQNKAPADLLIAIMDPSREAQPAFMSYTVILKDGRVFNGLIAAESANSLTLRKAEGKEDIIDRTSIEELVSSGKSLMPEGLEKELQPQDVADVIAFIKSLAPKK